MNLPELPIDIAPRTVDRVRSLMRLLALLALVAGLAALPWSAKAATSNCSSSGGVINFGTITNAGSQPVGAVLAQTQVTVTFNCTNIPTLSGTEGLYVQAGDLAARHSSDTGANGIVYATNLAGTVVKITGNPFQAKSQACLRCGPESKPGFEIGPITNNGGSGSISNIFTAQLIKTGTVATGTLNAITLMRFYWYEFGRTASSGPMSGVLQMNASTVRPPTCTVNTDSTNMTVTLPTISVRALSAASTTAGRTRFNINLTCEADAHATIMMDSTRQHPSIDGVVRSPTSGTWATNVAVQILDGNFSPVVFDDVTDLGAAPAGLWQLPYYAQYYRLGNPGSGAVRGVLTFTMSYD